MYRLEPAFASRGASLRRLRPSRRRPLLAWPPNRARRGFRSTDGARRGRHERSPTYRHMESTRTGQQGPGALSRSNRAGRHHPPNFKRESASPAAEVSESGPCRASGPPRIGPLDAVDTVIDVIREVTTIRSVLNTPLWWPRPSSGARRLAASQNIPAAIDR